MAANSDGLVIMNYDEHEIESQPGPIASQTFFLDNLKRALKIVPKEKILCAVGNYGYDWTMSLPGPVNPKAKKHPAAKFVPKVIDTEDITVQEAWQRASDADADLDLDYNSLNPHFSYIDEDDHLQHVVWFLVSVSSAGRDARGARVGDSDLCTVGARQKEDRSLWRRYGINPVAQTR